MRNLSRKAALASVLALLLPLSVGAGFDFETAMAQRSEAKAASLPASESFGRCFNLTSSAAQPLKIRCGVTPSDDSFVDNLLPTKTFGDWHVLILQDTPSIPQSKNYAYLKFDLTPMVPQRILTSHAKPTNATLWLWVRFLVAFYNVSTRIYRCRSNDWNENSITWISRPTYDPSSYASRIIRANGTWASWTVTNLLGISTNETSQVSFALAPSSTSWSNYIWFDSKEHPQGMASTVPELDLDFTEPFLKVETPYANSTITIDNVIYRTNSTGEFQSFVPWGEHKISVPEVIPHGEGEREVFVGWSDNITEASRIIAIGNNITLRPVYKTQYHLEVKSAYASTNGAGWYFKDKVATASVYPDIVPAEGLLGLLGTRHIFDHWTGPCETSHSDCAVIMNSAHTVTAVWRYDYTIPISGAICLLVLVTIVLGVFVRRRKRQDESGQSKSVI